MSKRASRTASQLFEWDVQLSPLGKKHLVWASRDRKHVNISLDGKITHKLRCDMYKSKYDFDDIVKVVSNKPVLKKINGRLGIVIGKAQGEENPEIFYYTINILDSFGIRTGCWSVTEDDLQPTGKIATPNNFKTGITVKVKVDPKTGEGSLIDEE